MNGNCTRTQTRKTHARVSSEALTNMIDFFVEKNGGGGSKTKVIGSNKDPNLPQPKREHSLLFNTTNSPDGFNHRPSS